jgi:hyperosmotically inducible protein
MKRMATGIALGLALSLGVGAVGCEREGPMERAGEKVDEAVDDALNPNEGAAEEAGEKVDEAVDDAKKKLD